MFITTLDRIIRQGSNRFGFQTPGIVTSDVSLDMVGSRILNVGSPVNDDDAVNKAYVDSRSTGLDTDLKMADVNLIAASNQSLGAGAKTIDGVAIEEGDRVALTNQTDSTENGIYEVQSDLSLSIASDWTNTPDGSWFIVTEGSTYENSGWYVTGLSWGAGTETATFIQFADSEGEFQFLTSYRVERFITSLTDSYVNGTHVAMPSGVSAGDLICAIDAVTPANKGVWVAQDPGTAFVRPSNYANGRLFSRGMNAIDDNGNVVLWINNGIVGTDDPGIVRQNENYENSVYLEHYTFSSPGSNTTHSTSFYLTSTEDHVFRMQSTQNDYSGITMVCNATSDDSDQSDWFRINSWVEKTGTEANIEGSHQIGLLSGNEGSFYATPAAGSAPSFMSGSVSGDFTVYSRSYRLMWSGVINAKASDNTSYFQGINAQEGNIRLYYVRADGTHVQRTVDRDMLRSYQISAGDFYARHHHMVFVHNSDHSIEFYYNGVRVDDSYIGAEQNAVIADAPANGTDAIVLNSNNNSEVEEERTNGGFDIQLFAGWNSALTEAQVEGLYNYFKGMTQADIVTNYSPTFIYNFTETNVDKNDTISDGSGNGYDLEVKYDDASVSNAAYTDFVSADFNLISFEGNGSNYEQDITFGSEFGRTQMKGETQLTKLSATDSMVGSAVLDGASPPRATVSAPAVTANTLILLTAQEAISNDSTPYIVDLTVGSGFTIGATHNGDTTTIAWMLVEPV